jgi:hypothetical protein
MTRSSAALGVLSIVLLGGLLAVSRAEDQARARPELPKDFPDPAALLKALKQTPGCLGADMARTEGGKFLMFAWFEDRRGLLNWYNGAAHKQAMKKYFGLDPSATPLKNVPDNGAPILVIASFTVADKAHLKETRLPVSQLAIELYQPLPGGIAAGGRFAPDGLKVPKLREYKPKEK